MDIRRGDPRSDRKHDTKIESPGESTELVNRLPRKGLCLEGNGTVSPTNIEVMWDFLDFIIVEHFRLLTLILLLEFMGNFNVLRAAYGVVCYDLFTDCKY